MTDPPPQLLLDDPWAYYTQLNDAGAIVLFNWLLYAGVPSQAFLFCARAHQGSMLRSLYAIGFHMCRSLCHKARACPPTRFAYCFSPLVCVLTSILVFQPNYVQICLQQLVTRAAVHPKIGAIIDAMMSVSPLGKKGSSIFDDRCLEMLNGYQDHRNGIAGSFDNRLHLGDNLINMYHASVAYDQVRACVRESMHAWYLAASLPHLAPPAYSLPISHAPCLTPCHPTQMKCHPSKILLNDPLKASTLTGATVLLDKMKSRLGTDMTADIPLNPRANVFYNVALFGLLAQLVQSSASCLRAPASCSQVLA